MKEKRISSPEIVLMDEHISILERCSAKYVNANTEGRKKIVRNAADTIEKNW